MNPVLLLLLVAVPQPGATTSPNLNASRDHPMSAAVAGIFIDACIRGELRLKKEFAKKVKVRHQWAGEYRLQSPNEFADYYEIEKPARSFLRVSSFKQPDKNHWISRCRLETDGHDIHAAFQIVAESLHIVELPKPAWQTYRYEILLPDGSSRIEIDKVNLTVSVYDREFAQRLQNKLRASKPVVRSFKLGI